MLINTDSEIVTLNTRPVNLNFDDDQWNRANEAVIGHLVNL